MSIVVRSASAVDILFCAALTKKRFLKRNDPLFLQQGSLDRPYSAEDLLAQSAADTSGILLAEETAVSQPLGFLHWYNGPFLVLEIDTDWLDYVDTDAPAPYGTRRISSERLELEKGEWVINLILTAEGRRGIGTALLTALLEKARREDGRRVIAEIDPLNRASLTFFQGHQFRRFRAWDSTSHLVIDGEECEVPWTAYARTLK